MAAWRQLHATGFRGRRDWLCFARRATGHVGHGSPARQEQRLLPCLLLGALRVRAVAGAHHHARAAAVAVLRRHHGAAAAGARLRLLLHDAHLHPVHQPPLQQRSHLLVGSAHEGDVPGQLLPHQGADDLQDRVAPLLAGLGCGFPPPQLLRRIQWGLDEAAVRVGRRQGAERPHYDHGAGPFLRACQDGHALLHARHRARGQRHRHHALLLRNGHQGGRRAELRGRPRFVHGLVPGAALQQGRQHQHDPRAQEHVHCRQGHGRRRRAGAPCGVDDPRLRRAALLPGLRVPAGEEPAPSGQARRVRGRVPHGPGQEQRPCEDGLADALHAGRLG
mmetsp:Transcript_2640/g.5814  ORF Transcript_2640/g.5814 Transcript_2640/m.5814 type:complete len:334 (+) Transcript_2640:1892-2893(+)